MPAYYNEIDPFAAAWLRELIKAGRIAPGDVDERSIEDVTPDDLRPYTQCHFFAGIGVWSYALRSAGWSDDRPVWTGSCPCQPFSAAGKGGGFADERHLWPAQFHLIRECRPDIFLGEQVASKDGLAWLDLVQADLEGSGYAVGAVDTCSAGHGAPHIRQRLRIAAQRLDHATGPRHNRPVGDAEGFARDEARLRLSGAGSEAERLADADGRERERFAEFRGGERHWPDAGRAQGRSSTSARGEVGGLADTGRSGDEPRGGLGYLVFAAGEEQGEAPQRQRSRNAYRDGGAAIGLADAIGQRGRSGQPRSEDAGDARQPSEAEHPGPVNGFWRDADWLFCRDGKWRPVEPGTFPLAHGAAARVGRLRGYGNAVDAEATRIFIEAAQEAFDPFYFRLTSAFATYNEGIFG